MSPRPLVTLVLQLCVCVLALTAVRPVASAARTFDFGDFSSAALVERAWKCLEAQDVVGVEAYVAKCRELHEEDAIRQQASLRAPVPAEQREAVFALYALNDVGTALFILGQAYERAGRTDDALAAYRVLVEKLSFAQCWDAKGWFWRPSEAAKGRIRALEFEAAQR